MKLDKRKLSGREKDQAAIELLEKLREQLYSSNLTVVRQSAFHLSWMQEDGLDILKEALYSVASKRTKNAATYGLRKMRGRMTKPALAVLEEGAESSDAAIAQICKNALDVLHNKRSKSKRAAPRRRRPHRFEIRELPARGPRRTVKPRRYVRHSARH